MDRHGHRGDDVDDRRALRVAAEHQPRVGAGAHHVLDVGAGVVGAVGRRRGSCRSPGSSRRRRRPSGRRPCRAERVDERAADGSPRPGVSSVPRAKTTSMSGQSCADAVEDRSTTVETAGAMTAAEAVRAATAEATSARRNRLTFTRSNDNAVNRLNQSRDEVRGLLGHTCAHVVAVGEGIAAARADRVAVLAQVDGSAAEYRAGDAGLPNFVEGLPNTATAATPWGRGPAASGGAEPISPILLPSGGTPASMSITAAPCE